MRRYRLLLVSASMLGSCGIHGGDRYEDVTLDATLAPASVPAGEAFTVEANLGGFTLDQAAYGGANAIGYGHLHVFLDEVSTETSLVGGADNPLRVPLPIATSVGSHDVIVVLHENDHTPLDPDVSVTLPISVVQPPPPSVSATLLNDVVEAGGYATVIVAVEGFYLDAGNYGDANVSRHGHFHVYLDTVTAGAELAGSAVSPYRLTIPDATAEGVHSLVVVLHENDHTELSPPVTYDVPIEVRVLAPTAPLEVAVEGLVTKLGAYLAGNTEYVADAAVLAYGVSPLRSATSSPAPDLGAYRLDLPVNGYALLYANKTGYYQTYTPVATQEENLVGKRAYLAEVPWVTAIADAHAVNLATAFPCHAPALNPADSCVYGMVVGRILDDGAAGGGRARPVAGVQAADFSIVGGAARAAWYTKGPYFLAPDGTVQAETASTVERDGRQYVGGLFAAFVEVPQVSGSPYVTVDVSITYADPDLGANRYFGPATVQVFRPYGVTWADVVETGTPVQPPVGPVANVDFDTQVYPLFLPLNQGGLGCQGCHTNAGGAIPSAGMNLYGGAAVAYAALSPASYPSRVNLAYPDQSYLLVRPLYEATGAQDHPIFAFASTQDTGYQTILAWIREGAQRGEVQLTPVSFVNEVVPLLKNDTATGGAGCYGCHVQGVDATTAPSGLYLGGTPDELHYALTQAQATDYESLGEPYRINKAGLAAQSLILVKPLIGSIATHPGKVFANNADPRYQTLYRWIVEGYQNDAAQ